MRIVVAWKCCMERRAQFVSVLAFACLQSLISAKALSVVIVTLLGVVVVSATSCVFVRDGWTVSVLVSDVVYNLGGK